MEILVNLLEAGECGSAAWDGWWLPAGWLSTASSMGMHQVVLPCYCSL